MAVAVAVAVAVAFAKKMERESDYCFVVTGQIKGGLGGGFTVLGGDFWFMSDGFEFW